MGAIGTVLLYRRGRRAEALTIGGICLCYLGYNSGYYLPFGGGFMGPRFLTTMLPFLAMPLGIAFKRFPAPTIALAAVSISTTVIATITHPLVGYETETVVWARYLREGLFQPTIASAYGLGRGWGGIWPFLLAAGGAVLLAAYATPAVRLDGAAMGAGVLVLAAWCAVRRDRSDAARHRPPGPSEHRQGRRPHRPAQGLRLLPAEDARPDRRGRRPAGARGRAAVAKRAGPAARAWSRGRSGPPGRAVGVAVVTPRTSPAGARPRARAAGPQEELVFRLHFAACSWRQTAT